MPSKADVLNAFLSKGITPLGPVVANPDQENAFMVFLARAYDSNGSEQPSERMIRTVVKMLKDQSINISIAFIDEKAASLDKAVSAMLIDKFQHAVKGSVVAFDNGLALVSVELTDQASNEDKGVIEAETTELLGYLGATKASFVFSNSLELPTVTAILGRVRKAAPVSVEELAEKLTKAGFEEPTEAWLTRILDRWRKKGLVYRRPDKRYILTLKGLNAAGTRRNRNSPDVSRALAMNRLD
jgi:hypothetical protein